MSGGVSATVKILLHPTKFYPSQMTPLFTQPTQDLQFSKQDHGSGPVGNIRSTIMCFLRGGFRAPGRARALFPSRNADS